MVSLKDSLRWLPVLPAALLGSVLSLFAAVMLFHLAGLLSDVTKTDSPAEKIALTTTTACVWLGWVAAGVLVAPNRSRRTAIIVLAALIAISALWFLGEALVIRSPSGKSSDYILAAGAVLACLVILDHLNRTSYRRNRWMTVIFMMLWVLYLSVSLYVTPVDWGKLGAIALGLLLIAPITHAGRHYLALAGRHFLAYVRKIYGSEPQE